MNQIEQTMNEFLDALAAHQGDDYRRRTKLRYAQGSEVVIEYPEGHKTIVSLGNLQLMTEHLKHQPPQRKAA